MDRRDIVSWNAVIGAHVLHEQFREALSLFKSMKMKPDAITFAIALTACASLEALEEGREIHRKTVEAGLESVTMVRNALVTMYARCGSLEDAQGAFTGTVYRDVVSWSALIAAHAQHGQDLEAIKVYRRMNLEGIEADVFTFASILSAVSSPGLLPEGRTVHRQIISRGLESDTVVGTALVNMYARCGDVVTARTNFDNLCSKNIVSWNAMIAGYVQAGSSQEALLLYEKMQQDEAKPKADGLTFASVLAACSNLGEISRGRKLHDDVAASDFAEDLIVQNALVDMYGKCGNLVESRNVFEGIKSRSVISWTSMVTAYARHGHGAEAVELVWRMSLEGVEADDVTLTSILQACSHSGLVDAAGSVFGTVVRDQGMELSIEHKLCLMDLLGRTGWIEEAEEFLASSEDLKARAASWTSFLSACERQSEQGRAGRAAREFGRLHPRESAKFVILSNMLHAI